MELTAQELKFQKVYIEVRQANEQFAQAILDQNHEKIEQFSEQQERLIAELLDPQFAELHTKFNNDMKTLLEECKVIETHLNKLAEESDDANP